VHYAGTVNYTAAGFLEKNEDTLFKDLSKLMFDSTISILIDQFPEGDDTTWAGAAKRPVTTGRAFSDSMKVRKKNEPSFVRH
jgi:myosin-1